jgi:hypothetical protein
MAIGACFLQGSELQQRAAVSSAVSAAPRYHDGMLNEQLLLVCNVQQVAWPSCPSQVLLHRPSAALSSLHLLLLASTRAHSKTCVVCWRDVLLLAWRKWQVHCLHSASASTTARTCVSLLLLVPACREELFNLINELPTCYEVVSGRAHKATTAAAAEPQPRKRGTDAAGGRPQQRTRMVGG